MVAGSLFDNLAGNFANLLFWQVALNRVAVGSKGNAYDWNMHASTSFSSTTFLPFFVRG